MNQPIKKQQWILSPLNPPHLAGSLINLHGTHFPLQGHWTTWQLLPTLGSFWAADFVRVHRSLLRMDRRASGREEWAIFMYVLVNMLTSCLHECGYMYTQVYYKCTLLCLTWGCNQIRLFMRLIQLVSHKRSARTSSAPLVSPTPFEGRTCGSRRLGFVVVVAVLTVNSAAAAYARFYVSICIFTAFFRCPKLVPSSSRSRSCRSPLKFLVSSFSNLSPPYCSTRTLQYILNPSLIVCSSCIGLIACKKPIFLCLYFYISMQKYMDPGR